MATTTDRRLRLCSVCGQLDDHPRHTQIVGKLDIPEATPDSDFIAALPDGCPAPALLELVQPGAVVRHIDCCAAKGCLLCQATEAVTGGVRGQDLIDAIDGGALDDHEPPAITTNEEMGLNG